MAERKVVYNVAMTLDHFILVDRLLIKLNPVVFSKGIPVFGDNSTDFALVLLDSKPYNNGVILLH
jgi:hypothetical protein